MACSRVNSTLTPRCLKILPSVRRTDCSPKEPQIVGFYMIGGPEQWGGLRRGLCEDLIYATVQDITYPWQSAYSDKYVFSVSEWIGQFRRVSLSVWNRCSPCTSLYDDNVCPRFILWIFNVGLVIYLGVAVRKLCKEVRWNNYTIFRWQSYHNTYMRRKIT